MKYFIALVFLFSCSYGNAQMLEKIKDSLDLRWKNASDVETKMDALLDLARTFNKANPTFRTETVEKIIFLGEETRDKDLISRAYRYAAMAYSTGTSDKANFKTATDYAEKAYKIGTEISEPSKDKFASRLVYSRIFRFNEKPTEAIRYANESIVLADESKDDSMRIVSRVSLSMAQLAAKQKIDAFKSLLAAQTISEKLDAGAQKDDLLLAVYSSFASFFGDIEKYERALDYNYKVLEIYQRTGKELKAYSAKNDIGYTMLAAKKNEAAKKTFEEMIEMAKKPTLADYRMSGLVGIVNCILSSDKPEEGLAYARKHPEMFGLYKEFNMANELDFAMAYLFTAAKQFDSAKYYYDKSYLPLVAKSALSGQLNFHVQYGLFFYKSKNFLKAAELYKKAAAINDSLQKATDNVEIYQMLDSCYQGLGDVKSSLLYNNKYLVAKQKLQELNSEKDVLNMEIDAENKRKERMEKEEAEETQKRHNWQYMGILVVILLLFTMLGSFGVFKVSTRLIRILGFVAFILLFEFIILIADTWIHHATHGEPWKILAIKVVLIAILLPLHHFLEHKVVHYISERQKRKAVS